jgi:hypothetical protein
MHTLKYIYIRIHIHIFSKIYVYTHTHTHLCHTRTYRRTGSRELWRRAQLAHAASVRLLLSRRRVEQAAMCTALRTGYAYACARVCVFTCMCMCVFVRMCVYVCGFVCCGMLRIVLKPVYPPTFTHAHPPHTHTTHTHHSHTLPPTQTARSTYFVC